MTLVEQIHVEGKPRWLAHFDSKIHMPRDAQSVAYYEDHGTIWTYGVADVPGFDINSVQIPDYIYEGIQNNRNRHQTQWVLRTNRNYSKYPWMGRASSMFISKRDNQQPSFNVDFFSEDDAHLWTGDPVMHDYLRDHYNNYNGFPYIKPPKLGLGGCRVLSGHIVPVHPSSDGISNIVLLDAINEDRPYENIDPQIKVVVDALWASRHMVVGPHAHVILPSTHPQKTK